MTRPAPLELAIGMAVNGLLVAGVFAIVQRVRGGTPSVARRGDEAEGGTPWTTGSDGS